MLDHGRKDRLYVFRYHAIAPVEQRPGLRGAAQRQPAAWRQAVTQPAVFARVLHQREQIVDQGRAGPDFSNARLQLEQTLGIEHGADVVDQIAALAARQQLAFRRLRRIAQRNPHQEAVELRFR